MVCINSNFVKQKRNEFFSLSLANSPPRDRTNKIIVFEHIYLSVFISITICSGIGLIISISLFIFNIYFRRHQ